MEAKRYYAASEPVSLGENPTEWLVKDSETGEPADDSRFPDLKGARRHADSLNALRGGVKLMRVETT
jgi:hypothetical protein